MSYLPEFDFIPCSKHFITSHDMNLKVNVESHKATFSQSKVTGLQGASCTWRRFYVLVTYNYDL